MDIINSITNEYKTNKSNFFSWVFTGVISFVFLQSLFFKFTNSPETQHIFGTIGNWFSTIGLDFLTYGFSTYGGYLVGVLELIAVIFLILKFKILGALLTFIIMSGAIFFHLITPLGIVVQGDSGTLFIMAVLVWASSIMILILNKKQLKFN